MAKVLIVAREGRHATRVFYSDMYKNQQNKIKPSRKAAQGDGRREWRKFECLVLKCECYMDVCFKHEYYKAASLSISISGGDCER